MWLARLLQTVALKFPGKMEGFLGSVNPAVEEGAGRSETVHFFIRHFQVGGGGGGGGAGRWENVLFFFAVSVFGYYSEDYICL